MYYIDTPDAVSASAKPTPPDAGNEMFFSDAPGVATAVPAWFLNMLQEELGNVVSGANLSHSKTDNSQLLKAVQALITSKTDGALLANKNLSDLVNTTTARSNLGLATVASSGAYADLSGRPDLSGYMPTSSLVATTAVASGGVIGPAIAWGSIGGKACAGFGETQAYERYTNFNSVVDSWGWSYVKGVTNGPPHGGTEGGYRQRVAIGAGYSSHGMELVIGHPDTGADGRTVYVRHAGANVWGGWQTLRAEDPKARAQIALTNFRLLLTTSVSSGALVAGQQWDLSSLTGFTTTGLMSASGDMPYLYNGMAGTVGPTGWVPVSGTTFAPTATLVDGTTAEASATGTTAYVGMASGGVMLTGYTLTCATVTGFNNNSGTVTVSVIGSATADPAAGTVLHTATYTDPVTATEAERVWSADFNAVTAYPYYYLRLTFASSVTWYLSSVTWRTMAVTSGAVITPAVTVTEVPSTVSGYFLWQPVGSAALSDLSVLLSRDGGSTWVTAPHTVIADYDSTTKAVQAAASMAKTGSGTSLRMRIDVSSANRHRIAAPTLYAG